MRHLRIIFFVLFIGYLAYDYANDADRDESGSIVRAGEIDAFAMRVGDCFNDPQEMIDAGSTEVVVQDVGGLPCSEPHDNEVYAVFDVRFEAFPGDASMSNEATNACLKYFEGFIGTSYEESVLDIFSLYPTDASWSQMNDREVVCAVYHINGKKLTGSIEGSAI